MLLVFSFSFFPFKICYCMWGNCPWCIITWPVIFGPLRLIYYVYSISIPALNLYIKYRLALSFSIWVRKWRTFFSNLFFYITLCLFLLQFLIFFLWWGNRFTFQICLYSSSYFPWLVGTFWIDNSSLVMWCLCRVKLFQNVKTF